MTKYQKNKNESFSEYCHRISSIVRYTEGLTWDKVKEIINNECNLSHTESYYRKKEKNYKAVNKLSEEEGLLELTKTRMKLSDERTQVNALIRRISREETLKEIAHDAVQHLNLNKQLSYQKPETILNTYRDGLLLISDWHYGIVIDNEFNYYDPDIAKDRIQQLLTKTIEKGEELSINTLHIANLGDMIAGNIHLPLRLNSRIDVITQVIEVSELLSEFINELSNHFNIKYYSVVDNHSRIEPKKSDSLELESLCRITDWYIKERLPQIEICEPDFVKDICTTTIRGHNVAFVHGHKDKQHTMIKELNNFTLQHFDLICSAHFHHFSADENCQTFMLANGSLMGTDDYAYNLRLHSLPSQTFISISDENVTEGIYKFNFS